jgi:hypothetical protein
VDSTVLVRRVDVTPAAADLLREPGIDEETERLAARGAF